MKQLLAVAIGVFLASCTSEGDPAAKPAAGDQPAPPAPAASGAAGQPAAGAPSAGIGTEVKAVAENNAAEIQKAAAKAAEGLPSDLGQVAEAGFSLDKLTALVAKLDLQQLQAVAERLVGAVKGQQGSVKGLGDEIGKLGALDVAKLNELRAKLDTATTALKDLKAKLQATVTEIKAKGGDASPYASALSG